MEAIKKFMAVASKKGFATEEEQRVVSEMAEKLSQEDYDEITDDLVAYEKLPLEKPVVGDENVKNENRGEENQPTETRAERRAKARAEKGK